MLSMMGASGCKSRQVPLLLMIATAVVALGMTSIMFTGAVAQQSALPTAVPKGTKLVVADQNEELQTLMLASGEQAKLAAAVTYANFLGGPAILEAFRAGALDLARVGNAPPIQAHAAGEILPIVAARTSSKPDYRLAVRPGLTLARLDELRGKRIAYGEGTGRQPFVLSALKLAGLTKKDVTLIPLRSADFPDAIRSGQVDVAPLNEPHFSRYLADYAGASALSESEHERLPRGLQYLYASGAALKDSARAAAIRDFVAHWVAAHRWANANPDAWVNAYYVKRQKLKETDGRKIVQSEGTSSLPLLRTLIAPQQGLIDLIHEAGDIRKRLDARDEFDLRFDELLAALAD
jgi:sulfonate transport system substrate-binding protein